MDLFKDFLVPLAIDTIVTTVVISVFAIFLFSKTIHDEEKRNKIITGYIFITTSILLCLVIKIFSFS